MRAQKRASGSLFSVFGWRWVNPPALAGDPAGEMSGYESFRRMIILPTTDDLLSSLLDEFKAFAKVQEGKADYVADKMSMREVLAAKQKRQAIEKLGEFYDNDASKKTVKELLTSTSNIALPTLSSEFSLKT